MEGRFNEGEDFPPEKPDDLIELTCPFCESYNIDFVKGKWLCYKCKKNFFEPDEVD